MSSSNNNPSRAARKTTMQRSNNNSPISAGNSTAGANSTASGNSNNNNKQTLSGTGRRSYNRSHNNNFKFHNFVFNETNQKFCLEEQHGNKKITVLHWKKTDEQQQQQPSSSNSQQPNDQLQFIKTESQPTTVRNCESDSKLIKSEKICYVPHLCKNDDEPNNDDNHYRHRHHFPDGDLSQEMDIHNERTTESLATSTAATTAATTMNTGLMASATFPLAYRSINSLQSAFESSPIRNESTSSFLPHHHPSDNSSLISSGHSSGSFLFPLDSSSSSANNFNYSKFDAKNSDESISKSHYSGSSLATTSSSCSGINFSLDNLKLNENIYRNSANSRRKYSGMRHVLIEDDSEEEEEESDHSDFEDNNSSRDLFFQTYRERIQQRIESLFEDTQSQPLDLSIKSKSNDFDLNNNKRIYEHSITIDNNEKDEAISGCESVDSFMHSRLDSPPATASTNVSSMGKGKKSDDSYFQWPSSSWMSESNVAHSSMRTESLSPSELISSIKCCSPLSDRYSKSRSMSTSNPFIFSSERTKRFEPMDRKESFSSSTSSSDLFDALLEEEIQKFLLNTNTSTFHSSKRPANDLNKKIEDKLKLLRQEVLNNKLSESHFFDFISEPAKDDHLRMHFKFDSNKNLEPYLDNFKSRSSVHSLSNQMLSQTNTLPKSRLNHHRNQIKRHMEDTFKQNGFLVKTKQVSDPNNSATFCKFRQLRKYTRYYLKSWQNQLPDEVNKLWKGFLPPKSERPIFLTPTTSSRMFDTSTNFDSGRIISDNNTNNNISDISGNTGLAGNDISQTTSNNTTSTTSHSFMHTTSME